MASVTITQVQLQKQPGNNPAIPTSLYWSTTTEKQMSINPINILAVGYVWDVAENNYVPGLIQIFLLGYQTPIYSSNSYASIVAFMNPTLT
jgi:hypothetical protein